MMGHHRHAKLPPSPVGATIAQATRTATQQRGNMALDHRAARATGARQFDLMRGTLLRQPRLGQDGCDRFGIRGGVDRFDAGGNADRAYAPLMEDLSDCGILDPHSAAHCMDGKLSRRGHAINRGLSAIHQRLDRADIIGVSGGQVRGKDEPDGGF